MPADEPLRDLVADVRPGFAQPLQTREDGVHKLAEGAGEVATSGILAGADHLDVAVARELHAAEGSDTPIGPSSGERGLLADAMIHPAEVRIGIHVGLVFVVEFIALRLGRHLFPPPRPSRPQRQRSRPHPGDV